MNLFRGEIEVEIGGKSRLIKFGTNQLAIFTQKHKINLSQVDFGMAHLRDLVWSGLVAGAKKKGEEVDFDEWQVGDWIDEMPEGGIEAIMEAFQNAMPKEGESKGKK